MSPRFLKIYLKFYHAFRVKYWRGHGVHSPFMYRIVRNAVMKHRIIDLGALPDINFRKFEISKRETVIIKNIYSLNRYESCSVLTKSATKLQSDNMYIIPGCCSDLTLYRTIESITNDLDNCCVVITGIHKSMKRYALCKKHTNDIPCVTLHLHKIFILFISPKLQKQHYRMRY